MSADKGPRQSKLDAHLHLRLLELEHARAARGEDHDQALDSRQVGVWVRFTGDLEAAKRAGFHPEVVAGPVATGTVAVGNLERLAASEGVVSVRAVQQYHTLLKDSVPAIHADHNDVVTVGGGSGNGVIVGVIDTGIDVFHHNFRNADGTTRVLALLDLTLRQTISISGTPTGGTFSLTWSGPASARFGSPLPSAIGLPFNATAQAISTALLAMRTGAGATVFNAADIAVAGGPLPAQPITVDIQGQYAGKEVTLLDPTPALTGDPFATLDVTRGREFTAADINAALTGPGQTFVSMDFDGHGTHVAGIAAGNGSQGGKAGLLCHPANTFVGVAPQASLVIVKKPFETADGADPIVRGVQFIFNQASTAHQAAVVNISLGGNVGAHDGTSDEETALSAMLVDLTGEAIPGRAIVLSAGNEGVPASARAEDLRARHHARKQVPANGSVSLSFTVPANCTRRHRIDIWYEGATRLNCTVTPPAPPTPPPQYAAGGPVMPPAISGIADNTPLSLTSNRPNQPAAANSAIAYTIDSLPTSWPGHGNDRHKHEIQLSIGPPPSPPGAPPPPAGTIPPPNPIANGTWTITLTETAGTAADVDAWITATHEEIRGGTQPTFVASDADNTRTLTVPATAANVIATGSYDYRDNTLSDFSSRGPTLDTSGFGLLKPDICAPGAKIVSAKTSVRDPGCWCDCCYHFYIDDSGTSMAAPHVVGIVALIFEKNGLLGFDEVRNVLTSNALPPDPITAPMLPNADWGTGIIDAVQALSHVAGHARAGEAGVAARRPDRLSPAAAAPASYPTPGRIAALREKTAIYPWGSLAAALVSTHFDEVQRLVNSNRRILIVWHRMGGPELLREAMRFADGRAVRLPAQPSGRTLTEWLQRLLDLLHEYGSPTLRADVERYRTEALELVRAFIADPEDLRLAG